MGYALPLTQSLNTLVPGTVQSADGDALLVVGSAGLVRAVRAESCLLAPKTGDAVLLALLENNEAWVLAVLRRQGGRASLRLPAATSLEAGQLHIRAAAARLEARQLDLCGQAVRLEGDHIDMRARLLSLGGQVLLQGFAVVQNFARKLKECVFRRNGRYAQLTESVTGLAERRAGRVRLSVRSSWRLRATRADMRAKEQVDIDASHIKVG